MSVTMKDLGIENLSREDRARLALEIWASLGDDAGAIEPLTTAQRDELHRRDAELEANPELALRWEEIRGAVEKSPSRPV